MVSTITLGGGESERNSIGIKDWLSENSETFWKILVIRADSYTWHVRPLWSSSMESSISWCALRGAAAPSCTGPTERSGSHLDQGKLKRTTGGINAMRHSVDPRLILPHFRHSRYDRAAQTRRSAAHRSHQWDCRDIDRSTHDQISQWFVRRVWGILRDWKAQKESVGHFQTWAESGRISGMKVTHASPGIPPKIYRQKKTTWIYPKQLIFNVFSTKMDAALILSPSRLYWRGDYPKITPPLWESVVITFSPEVMRGN